MSRSRFLVDQLSENVLKQRLLSACRNHSHAVFLDSNDHYDQYSRYDWIAAVGAKTVFTLTEKVFCRLQKFREEHSDWLFGHLTYDLKNDLEALETQHPDLLQFPKLEFFVPEVVLYKRDGEITAESFFHKDQEALIADLLLPTESLKQPINPELTPRTGREEYLAQVASLKDHLRRGNIYEVNYCIEFAASAEGFSPLHAFQRLNESSRAPFAAYYKNEDRHLLCASPERYLQKRGSQIISQPIKGTAKRSTDPKVDENLKKELSQSEKERSENVMITDLVRNDLSRTAADGSVKVEELFGIYSFNTVHQMITTISSRLGENYKVADLLETTFPMGSMTGAPKVRAMKLIDEHENFARSLYAGTVGYITPSGDFDFNVVIRSLLYNEQTGYLSARVGSAITIHCDAEKEYEECLLKAANLFNSLKPEAAG